MMIDKPRRGDTTWWRTVRSQCGSWRVAAPRLGGIDA